MGIEFLLCPPLYGRETWITTNEDNPLEIGVMPEVSWLSSPEYLMAEFLRGANAGESHILPPVSPPIRFLSPSFMPEINGFPGHWFLQNIRCFQSYRQEGLYLDGEFYEYSSGQPVLVGTGENDVVQCSLHGFPNTQKELPLENRFVWEYAYFVGSDELFYREYVYEGGEVQQTFPALFFPPLIEEYIFSNPIPPFAGFASNDWRVKTLAYSPIEDVHTIEVRVSTWMRIEISCRLRYNGNVLPPLDGGFMRAWLSAVGLLFSMGGGLDAGLSG